MSQTPNLDAARASLQQAIDQANAIVKPVIDAMRETGLLAPTPEPAAAPAVDDDLMRLQNVWRERDDLALRLEGVEAHRDRLLDDARTRDAELTEAVRERDEARAASIRARRERNHAQALAGPACSCVVNRLAESHDGHCCVAGPGTEPNCHQQEVDAYRSLAEAREALGEIGELVDPWMGLDGSIVDGVRAVIAEVERLRAAQQLPDVGPARRSRRFIEVDGHSYADDYGSGDFRLRAARLLAVAAFLDVQAADTSSDDEVDQVTDAEVDVVRAELGGGQTLYIRRAIRALDAHRARGGQEAGQ